MMIGVVGSLGAARLAGRFRSMKAVLVWLNAANVVALAVFAAVVQPLGHLSPEITLEIVWITSVVSSLATFATVPLFFELLVESSFPAPSSLVLLVSVFANNASNLALIFIPLSTAAAGFNWGYFGGCTVMTLVLAFGYRERLQRLQYDESIGCVSMDNAVSTPSLSLTSSSSALELR